MPVSETTFALNTALQAERILKAWASGDEPSLHRELQKSRQLSRLSQAPGMDEERMELLLAVTEGMLSSPDPLASDPPVRRCLDLLKHLAHPAGLNRAARRC